MVFPKLLIWQRDITHLAAGVAAPQIFVLDQLGISKHHQGCSTGLID